MEITCLRMYMYMLHVYMYMLHVYMYMYNVHVYTCSSVCRVCGLWEGRVIEIRQEVTGC